MRSSCQLRRSDYSSPQSLTPPILIESSWSASARRSAALARGHRRLPCRATAGQRIAKTTNITEDHHRAFEALTSSEAGKFSLFSCFCSATPAAAIAAVTVCPPADDSDEPEYVISPLFVSITPDMKLVYHDGREA